jgi:hypothetical protein
MISSKFREDVSDFLAADTKLHLNEAALERVVARLKTMLVEMIENKRAARLESRNRRPKTSSLPSRSDSQSGRQQKVIQEINLSVTDTNDSFVNTCTLTRRAICAPAQFLLNERAGEGYLTRPRTTGGIRAGARGSIYAPSGVDVRSVSPNIMNRLSLKVYFTERISHKERGQGQEKGA